MSSETLRYATLSLSLSGSVRSPLIAQFDRSPAVDINSIRYLGPVEDDQHVGLSDLTGDLDIAREVLDTSDEVLQYDIAGTDDHGIVYGYYQTVGPIGDLLGVLYHNDIVLDWPMEPREAGDGFEIEFTVIGTETGIQQAADEIPETVGITLERIGQFESSTETASLLTDEQAALLTLAAEEGYYEVPRETTQRALADHLGVAAGTIGDRLQRIERRVMITHAEVG